MGPLPYATRTDPCNKALASLDQLERVRHDGGPDEDIGELMHAFSEILLAPPAVEILRVDETPAPAP
jgi:hypothetical protein